MAESVIRLLKPHDGRVDATNLQDNRPFWTIEVGGGVRELNSWTGLQKCSWDQFAEPRTREFWRFSVSLGNYGRPEWTRPSAMALREKRTNLLRITDAHKDENAFSGLSSEPQSLSFQECMYLRYSRLRSRWWTTNIVPSMDCLDFALRTTRV